MTCRHCQADLSLEVIDLGSSPPANNYLGADDLSKPETWLPLRLLICTECWLAQTEDVISATDLFTADYAYFSGYSSTWLTHCADYVDKIVRTLKLGPNHRVIEVGTNDGSLLSMFNKRKIQCLGIEPTAGTAAAARALELNIIEEFMTLRLADQLASEGIKADLLIANNVVAHVPDINDFLKSCACLLTRNGVATFEFQHLYQLIVENQFDTIYHEHFSYLSLTSAQKILAAAGLKIFDVERIPTHGGSLRIYAQLASSGLIDRKDSVGNLLAIEASSGITSERFYEGFAQRSAEIRDGFLEFLEHARLRRETIGAYGAAAKGNTFLNYAKVTRELIDFVVDQNPVKQGKYLPGSHIEIVPEDHIGVSYPNYLVILPWNLRDEITAQLSRTTQWRGSIVTAIPSLRFSSPY